MLADGIEASTRSILDPTVEKIEANIDSLIKLRLLEGELDDSNLNLRDLNIIKESFLKILVGIHHSRLQYPEKGADPQSVSEPESVRLSSKKISDPGESTDKRLQRTIENIDLK